MEQATHAPHVPPPERAVEIQQAVHALSLKFISCHEFLADQTYMLATLLREAESRGILLHEAFALADAEYWLQHIDWQTKFLKVVLAFAQDPSRTTLRPLIELYGCDRERMRGEVEILGRQLEQRLATFAKPGDAQFRKAVTKNQKRVLAAYLHVRSGYGGAALARFFNVPRSTAYGWLDWFRSLPDGLRDSIVAFIDSQARSMAANQPITNRVNNSLNAISGSGLPPTT
jgi:hypothetical protein